jgi:hypothetical protein
MPSSEWFEKTCTTTLLLAAPAAALLGSVYWGSKEHIGEKSPMPFAFWSALIALLLFAISILNIILSWSVSFMVGWPLAAIPLTALGLALYRGARPGDRRRLVISNILLLVLSFASIVAPN